MAEMLQVAAFEGGSLRLLDEQNDSKEVVLALPLNRLVVKMMRVPLEAKDDPVAFLAPLLQKLSPFPDEALSVGYEQVGEDERGMQVIAAAIPESAADDIASALDEKKLNVTRIDALELGELRGLWSAIGAEPGGVRKLVALKRVDGVSLVVLDGELPAVLRTVNDGAELKREIMLSLLEAEDFGGARPLVEIVLVGDVAAEGLEAFAPIRTLTIGEDAALVGVAERSAEPGALNVLPSSWQEVLDETRFKAKLGKCLAVAIGIWVLAMGVLFGVPVAYGFMTDNQKELCRAHQKRYRIVSETRDKVNLVRKYSDHSRGALEIMKAVSDRLPAGITLSSWNFKRDEGVTVSGEADDAVQVYDFKDQMVKAEVFAQVNLKGPSAGKGGKQRFDLECLYEGEEEEE